MARLLLYNVSHVFKLNENGKNPISFEFNDSFNSVVLSLVSKKSGFEIDMENALNEKLTIVVFLKHQTSVLNNTFKLWKLWR